MRSRAQIAEYISLALRTRSPAFREKSGCLNVRVPRLCGVWFELGVGASAGLDGSAPEIPAEVGAVGKIEADVSGKELEGSPMKAKKPKRRLSNFLKIPSFRSKTEVRCRSP